jgi:glycosyltransferase involved in cell wall biosynthesis
VRVAYFHYLAPGDSALTHVAEFVRAARALGTAVDVHALHGGGAAAPNAAQPPGAAAPTAPRSALRRRVARYLHEPKELSWNARHLRNEARILAANRPDVLLARARLLTASYVLSARRAGVPLVLEVNAPVLESHSYADEYFHLPVVATALERWQLRAADGVVVVSSALRQYCVERHGLPADKIAVVPNGADIDRFRPDVAADPRGGPRDQAPVIGFVGSFQEFHGADLLATMITRVARERPDTRFLLVGDGERAEVVRRAVQPLGARVRMTGRVPHDAVPGLVAAFDIGVLPDTAFYCSPLKVVEWMAAGRAVVAPGYPSLGDLVTDGVDGVLFTPRDPDALVRAVLALVDDPARRVALGRAARARAETRLTWRQNAERVLAACRDAIARHGAARPS